MPMTAVLDFLDGAPVGVFGAGHLGRALGLALLRAGLPPSQLLLCHSGSAATAAALADAGLAAYAVPPATLCAAAKLVLYVVRPQAARALDGLTLRRDAVLVSFLAGIALRDIPAAVPLDRRRRVMISDPDSLAKANGIAACAPADPLTQALLAALGTRVTVLADETHFAAFTALGPCLPMAAAWCLGHGVPIAREDLRALGARYGMADYDAVVAWALDVCPKGLSTDALAAYLRHAATPGGVTEAVLDGLKAGEGLPAALERGVTRCEELARG